MICKQPRIKRTLPLLSFLQTPPCHKYYNKFYIHSTHPFNPYPKPTTFSTVSNHAPRALMDISEVSIYKSEDLTAKTTLAIERVNQLRSFISKLQSEQVKKRKLCYFNYLHLLFLSPMIVLIYNSNPIPTLNLCLRQKDFTI